MPKSDIEKAQASALAMIADKPAWAAVQAATDENGRYEAAQAALETARFTRSGKEIPFLVMDLPWADDGQAVGNILTNLILSADIAEATQGAAELTKVKDIIDLPVTVHAVTCRESDVEGDGSWGVYLSLDVSVRGGPREIVNTGARQVIVTMWRLYCEDAFPVIGQFVKLGNPAPGRSQPVGFRIENPFK